jgi:hypothetical protein
MANLLQNNNFPDDNVSNVEKLDNDFGKEVGEAIYSQWGLNGNLSFRRQWIQKMRSYSRGEQDTDYRKVIEGKNYNKDVKTHKIEYDKLLKIMSSFKDIVINPIDESLFKPRAEAIDEIGIDEKKNYFDKLQKAFLTKDLTAQVSKNIGLDLRDPNTPKDQDDLNVQKLEYKPMIELAQELAIEEVMKHQDFERIKDKIDEDLFDLGIGVGRHYTTKNEGIITEYVDPYNYVHSSFEMDDGRDIRYHGVFNEGTLAELEAECGGLTDAQRENIIESAKKSQNNHETRINSNQTDEEDETRLYEWISYAYKTSLTRAFKKQRTNKSTVLIDRTEDEGRDTEYNPNNPDKKLTIPYNIWFEGIYVPYAQECVQWELIENQVDKGVNNAMSPFIVFAPKVKRNSETGTIRFDSMTSRAIPILDDIQTDWFKFQQLKRELRPNTVEIDTDALNDVMLGTDKVSPQDLLNMFFGRGVLLKRGTDDDGDPMNRAITENNGGVNNSSLSFLSNEMANNLGRLRQILGINEIRDGSAKPNSKTAVAVQKILFASSNNATSHIVKGSFAISLEFATAISHRLFDVLSTPDLKDMYMSIIGRSNVEVLDEIKNLPNRRFGIYFDFKPDNEERVAFEQTLLDSYAKGEVTAPQYLKARQIRNVKNAIKYMEIVVEENATKKEQATIRNMQAQAEAQAKTSVMTEQARQQTSAIELDAEMTKLRLTSQLADESFRKKTLAENALSQEQHLRKLEQIQLESTVIANKLIYQEEKKDDREDQRAGNQSKLIDKRKNGTDPNFNRSIDNIFATKEPIDQKI